MKPRYRRFSEINSISSAELITAGAQPGPKADKNIKCKMLEYQFFIHAIKGPVILNRLKSIPNSKIYIYATFTPVFRYLLVLLFLVFPIVVNYCWLDRVNYLVYWGVVEVFLRGGGEKIRILC